MILVQPVANFFALSRLLQSIPVKSPHYFELEGGDFAIYEVLRYCGQTLCTYVPAAGLSLPPFLRYVHCETLVNSFICGLVMVSITIKPHTLQPAALVPVLQRSRLYFPEATAIQSLKLQRLRPVRLFSSRRIW